MDAETEQGTNITQALLAAGEHIDRLLSAKETEQVVELTAELVLAVIGAEGVQVFGLDGEDVAEMWAAGQLTGDEAERQAMAATAFQLARSVFGEQVSAIPIRSDEVSAVIVAEGSTEIPPKLAELLSDLGSKGLRAVEVRRQLGRQHALRLALGRYVCPSIAVTLSRDRREDLEPSQRAVSVLTLVVAGLSDQVDLVGAEPVLPILNQFFETITNTIYENEGALLSFGLEGFSAVFGAPIRADDVTQADLATASGFRVLQGLEAMVERWGVEGLPVHLEARAGVSTGSAMVGSFGSAERPIFTAVGAHVALARELALQGNAGELVVDSATRSLLADRLETRSIGAVEVKGLDYPVFAYGADLGGDRDR